MELGFADAEAYAQAAGFLQDRVSHRSADTTSEQLSDEYADHQPTHTREMLDLS